MKKIIRQFIARHRSNRISAAAATHVGLRRCQNEDAYVVMHSPGGLKTCMLVAGVFDGVGGAVGGAIASSIASTGLTEYWNAKALRELKQNDIGAALSCSLKMLNDRIRGEALADPEKEGMATTATVAAVPRSLDGVWIAHVGDSPAFRIRHNAIEKLLVEDSLVSQLVAAGDLTEEQAHRHPQRHVITKALGLEPTVAPTVVFHDLWPGDIILLCTDGLSDVVSTSEIATVLCNTPIAIAAQILIALANAHGGPDNITTTLIRRLE